MTESRGARRPVATTHLSLPLRLTVAYVCVTVLAYMLGPYGGEDGGGWAVTRYLIAVLVAFALGYRAANFGRARLELRPLDEGPSSQADRTATNVVRIGSLWFLTFSLASLQRVGVTNPVDLLRAITDPRGSYYAKFASLAPGDGDALYQVLNLLGAFYFLTVPYLLLYWNRLTVRLRALAISSLTLYLLFFLSVGTQKGVADLLIMFLACALPLRMTMRRSVGPKRRGAGSRIWLGLGAIAVVAAVLAMVISLGLRTDETSSSLQDPYSRALYESLRPFFGEVLARGSVLILSYLTQGYHGLALALQLPFVPAGGLGAYRGLSSYLPQYLGIADPYLVSYPVRVGEAFPWSATGKWTSVYPWYASDVSFAGVILLALIFGFFLARVWRRLLLNRDGLTLSVFVLCAFLVLYSPANNQLFNDRLSALGVLTLMGAYLVRELAQSRGRGPRRRQSQRRPSLQRLPRSPARSLHHVRVTRVTDM